MSRAEYAREWAKNRTPEQIETKRQSAKAWRKANRDKLIAAQDEWRKANKDKVTEFGRKATRKILYLRYGLSLDDYATILLKQKGVCAICKNPPGKRPLSVDHCHKTGVVRGLLCHGCNTGIGFLKDDPALVRRAMNYLTRRPKWQPKK